jgi:hypothetical protein
MGKPDDCLNPLDRRSWWEFCVSMAEFLGNLVRDSVVDPESAHHLCRLQWICINGSYVFATRDPAVRADQARYIELCGCLAAAFAVVVDDPEGIRDLNAAVFGSHASKQPAINEALVGEPWLRRWRTWEDATSPIGWVHHVAERIHREQHPIAMDQGPKMSSLDAPSPTGDPYAALLPDLQSTRYAEIDVITDLDAACKREGLTPETAQLARGRYNRVPYTAATEVLGLSEEDLAAAKRELQNAMPALQAELAPYLQKRKSK